jgi:hypothetical protein
MDGSIAAARRMAVEPAGARPTWEPGELAPPTTFASVDDVSPMTLGAGR